MSDLPYFEPLSKGVKIFAVSAALLVVVSIAADVLGPGPFFSIGVGIEILFKLCVGWLAFVARTVPKMQANYLLLANGLLGLLLGVAALQWVMRTLFQSNSPASCPWRWKWTIAATSMFALLFGICVSAVGIATHGSSLFQEPVVKTHPSRSTIHRDVTNARQLYVETTIADDERGRAPLGGWAALAKSTNLDPAELNSLAVVRSLPTEEPPEVWVYLQTPDDYIDSGVPLFCAPRPHVSGKLLVSFADGTARVCSQAEYDEAIAQWHFACSKVKSGNSSPTGGLPP